MLCFCRGTYEPRNTDGRRVCQAEQFMQEHMALYPNLASLASSLAIVAIWRAGPLLGDMFVLACPREVLNAS